MIRRLPALVLALVIVGAPLAATMCLVTCESHAMEGMVGHAHHHSSTLSPLFVDAEMSGLPHACDHQIDDPVAVQQVLQVLTAPAVVTVQYFVTPAEGVSSAAWPFDIQHSPPGTLTLTAQLRV